ncbi:MAG: hypothetical protein ABEK84_08010 [Salinibacter sp.]
MTLRTTVLAAVATLLLAGSPVGSAAAQPLSSPDSSVEAASWPQRFGAQVRRILDTGDPERQELALRLVLQYAKRSDLNIDFGPAIPALFEVYERAEQEHLRIMALNALVLVGEKADMARLAHQVRFEQSERVRRHTLRALQARHRRRGETEM